MRRLFLPLIATVYALPAWAEAPKVVTDIAPVHALVTMVMGDRGTPDCFCPRAATRMISNCAPVRRLR